MISRISYFVIKPFQIFEIVKKRILQNILDIDE